MCDGWLLERFCCPGDINSVPELNVLRNAFLSGAASFRELSDEELDKWRRERHQVHVDSTSTTRCQDTSSAVDFTATVQPNTSVPASAVPIAPTATAQPSSLVLAPSTGGTSEPLSSSPRANIPFVLVTAAVTATAGAGQTHQAVFAVNGGGLVAKKPRKPHEDKGKKQGPYKRREKNANVDRSATK